MGDEKQEVEEREADAAEAGDSAGREVKWAVLPDGLKVLPAPEKLRTTSLLNKLVYIRWEVHTAGGLAPSHTRSRMRRRVSSSISTIESSTQMAPPDQPTYPSTRYAQAAGANCCLRLYNSWCLLEKDDR